MLFQHVREPGLDPHPQVLRREPASLTGVVQEHLGAIFRVGLSQPLLSYSLVKQTNILSVRTQVAPSILPTAWVGGIWYEMRCQQERSHLGLRHPQPCARIWFK